MAELREDIQARLSGLDPEIAVVALEEPGDALRLLIWRSASG
jgi:hypothetical protein